MELQALIKRIDVTKKLISDKRPLAPKEVKELDAYFRIGTTYTSNALEGNTLTLTETKVLLEDGLTAGGKPLRDSYEALGHANAYDFMLETARSDPFEFNEHPVILSAYAHQRLVDIHPFEDGNGRTARLLMNLILINKGYQIVSIPPVLRQEYIDAINKGRRSGSKTGGSLARFIAECEVEAQKDFCRMFHMELPKI